MSAELLLRRREMMKSAAAAVDPYLLQPFTMTFTNVAQDLYLYIANGGNTDIEVNENPLSSLYIKKNDGQWTQMFYGFSNDLETNVWYFGNDPDDYVIDVQTDDVLQIKATGSWAISSSKRFSIFNMNHSPSNKYNLSGNINSLIHGDNFVGSTSVPNYALYGLFGTGNDSQSLAIGLVDASNLRLPATQLGNYCYGYLFYFSLYMTEAMPELPATTLSEGCYRNMFMYCNNLKTAPVLPALHLVSRCYLNMFRQCTKLNYVKAMFIDEPNTNTLNGTTGNWLQNVASSGTFVKNSAATWTTSGVSGVPSGWTIQYASS